MEGVPKVSLSLPVPEAVNKGEDGQVEGVLEVSLSLPIPEAVNKAEDGQVEGVPEVPLLLPAQRKEVEDRSQTTVSHQLYARVLFYGTFCNWPTETNLAKVGRYLYSVPYTPHYRHV